MTSRHREVARRITELAEGFPHYLSVFESRHPFRRPGQLECHVRTIGLRRQLGTAEAALADAQFTASLHRTLVAWQMNQRGASLKSLPEMRSALLAHAERIAVLDGLTINECREPGELAGRLWNLIAQLDLCNNNAKLVTGTKALHHLLPDLVMPMDRAYTRVFFRWYQQMFQYGQEKFLKEVMDYLVDLAEQVSCQQYVTGRGWKTSRTKILDNAIVGYCLEKSLMLS